jgi:phage shock protein A
MAVVHPESAQSVDLTGIAAILSAGIGCVGFVATMLRHKKTKATVAEAQQAASYVAGFNTLITRLQEEITELRQSHDEEHENWARERAQLQRTIEKLKTDLTQAIAEGAELRGQLAELRGQIKGFLNQQQYEEFKRRLLP